MASFNYMNNTAPFWDFVASLERQGNNHPFFGQNPQDRNEENEHGEDHIGQHPHPSNSWPFGYPLFGGTGGLPHRGPPPPPPGPHGPPPPGPRSPPSHQDENTSRHEHDGEKDGDKSDHDNDNDNGEGPAGSGSDGEGGRRCGRGRHGHCGSRRGRHGPGGRGGFGPHHGGPGYNRHRGPPGFAFFPPHDGPRGGSHGHGPRGHHHPGRPGGRPSWGWNPFTGRGYNTGANFNPANMFGPFYDAFVAEQTNDAGNKDNEDFTPEADIFDTQSSYIIHVSLPGAKKEDVGVNWDAEKSELSVAGVIYRPGDEELLKTLAMNERKVGPFERKIRLGTRANPAHVDAEGITAKLEDGVLRIEVRKEDEGFVEIKKVDIE